MLSMDVKSGTLTVGALAALGEGESSVADNSLSASVMGFRARLGSDSESAGLVGDNAATSFEVFDEQYQSATRFSLPWRDTLPSGNRRDTLPSQ